MTTTEQNAVATAAGPNSKPNFAIFRWANGIDLVDSEAMTAKFTSDEQRNNVALLGEANSRSGTESRFLFAGPGFSLVHLWFKSGFPLPLHSHDADCLYYVIAGSLRIGTETLAAGDGFFVPTDAPYTYVAGKDGVEILEFRNADAFDVRFPTTKRDYWTKLAATIKSRALSWTKEQRPPVEFPDFD